MIDTKTRLQSRVVKAVTVGDIALLYTDFEGTTVDPSGKTVDIRHNAIEILRRQPNGDWKLIVGDPSGRNRIWATGTTGMDNNDRKQQTSDPPEC